MVNVNGGSRLECNDFCFINICSLLTVIIFRQMNERNDNDKNRLNKACAFIIVTTQFNFEDNTYRLLKRWRKIIIFNLMETFFNR